MLIFAVYIATFARWLTSIMSTLVRPSLC